MHHNIQRVISVVTISLISFLGLESLVLINNLYQERIYILSSIYFYVLLLIWLHFIFDLHFKEKAIGSSIAHSIYLRFRHFLHLKTFFNFQNYLILPAVLYWGAVILIGINFGHTQLQQVIAIVTSLALVIVYTLFKEIFRHRFVSLHNRHFILLTNVKIYASWLVYSAAVGITWYYCFPASLLYAFIFLVTFMLMYQALFQFHELTREHVWAIIGVSMVLTVASFFVYSYWNVNYFSAGLFMTGIYNFTWSMLYHTLKKTLTKEVFLEHLAILAVILVVVIGGTNFKAQIDRCGI
jgi:hypothetical protein